VAGNGKIVSTTIKEEFRMGESILIPATLGEYRIIGEGLKIIKSYVPDVKKVEKEILEIVKK